MKKRTFDEIIAEMQIILKDPKSTDVYKIGQLEPLYLESYVQARKESSLLLDFPHNPIHSPQSKRLAIYTAFVSFMDHTKTFKSVKMYDGQEEPKEDNVHKTEAFMSLLNLDNQLKQITLSDKEKEELEEKANKAVKSPQKAEREDAYVNDSEVQKKIEAYKKAQPVKFNPNMPDSAPRRPQGKLVKPPLKVPES